MRALAAITLAAGLLTAGFQAPFSATPASDDYPLEVGLRWTYRALGGVKAVRHIRAARRPWFEMTFQLPLYGTHMLPMRRTSAGVLTLSEGREHLLMKFPMRAGDGWRIDVPAEKEIADCEVVGEEEIVFLGKRAPATKVRVTRASRATGKRWVDYEWYAPGVGLVRMQVFGVVFTLEQFERGVE